MKPKVYLETSILSYLAARPSRDPVTAGRQILTQRWWEQERHKYRLLVSEAVEAECERGNPVMARRRLALLADAYIAPLDRRILEVAKLLLVPGALPETAADGLHIAAAAVHGCEYLLTWNFRHIANVQLRRAVERILAKHGFSNTTICTPEELA